MGLDVVVVARHGLTSLGRYGTRAVPSAGHGSTVVWDSGALRWMAASPWRDGLGNGETCDMRGFGELESKIMDALWRSGRPGTVRDVLEELRGSREIAYTTVMTVMDNLHRKGFLQRERDGRAYRYVPSCSREQYVAELMRDALATSTDQAATLELFTERLSEDESLALRTALRRLARRRQ